MGRDLIEKGAEQSGEPKGYNYATDNARSDRQRRAAYNKPVNVMSSRPKGHADAYL